MKYIIIYLFMILIVTFLVGVTDHYFNYTIVSVLFIWLVYIAFYSFMFFGSLIILMFFFQFISEIILNGFLNAVKIFYPIFFSILLLFLSAFLLGKFYKYITNSFVIRVENKSDSNIDDIFISCRMSMTSMFSLGIGQNKEITVRGKEIIRDLSYEDNLNNIYFNYTTEGKDNTWLFADETNTIISDTLLVTIIDKDALSVNTP